MQLSTKCNGRCFLCPHKDTYRKGTVPNGKMEKEIFRRLCQQLSMMGFDGELGLYMHFEPLIDDSLFDRIVDVKRILPNAKVSISTNGSLLDVVKERRLVESGLDKVYMHLLSGDKEQYESNTGLNFDVVVGNMKRMFEKKFGQLEICVVTPNFSGLDTKKLDDLFGKNSIHNFWATSRGGNVESGLLQTEGKQTRYNDITQQRCFQPERNLGILFDGSMLVCSQDWRHESKKDFPNMSDVNLADAYNNGHFKTMREEFAAGNYNRYSICKKCFAEHNWRK